jgi:hypothetical protein
VLFTSFEPDREVESLLDIWPLARGQLR